MGEELVTILFTDVEGSTALHSAKGDSEARAILAHHDELVRREIDAQGGREVKALGDGLMVAFGSPLRAVACARGIQDAVRDHAHDNPGQELRIRVGIHTGLVADEAGDLFGSAVNAAARIAARAGGGEILVSDVVRQLCRSAADITFEDRGQLRLKGFPDRWHLYRVVPRLRGTPPGEATAFVGREAERAELQRLLQRAAAGQGGVVMIGGEPGVGKSRLALQVAADAGRPFRVFVGHCYESQGDLPFMPWVEILEHAGRDIAPDTLRKALGDDAAELARVVPQFRRLFPDIPPPLELPPEQQRRFTFNSVAEYVTRVSRIRPQLLVLEDLHWADDSTLLFLEYLAERLATIPCLVVGTFRDPPLDVPRRLADTLSVLVSRRQARILSLTRHSVTEVEAILRALSGHVPPPAVTAAIYAETEGNAFFVEEVFRHLAESGNLLVNKGQFREDLRIAELDVPANVRLVIGQRLERLGEATRQALSVAAVVGRRFSFEILEAAGELGEDALLDAVDEAQRAHLVVSESAGGQEHLWFAHELIRQTLLAGLSAPRRRRQHLRVADALERLYADDLATHAADIVHHLQAADGEDPVRTAKYLTLAGDRAMGATAFDEALRSYQAAIGLLPAEEARRRGDLLLKVGNAYRSLSRLDDAIVAWDEATTILESVGDVEAVAAVCWDLGLQLGWTYRGPEMMRVAQRGLGVVKDFSAQDRARMLALMSCSLVAMGRFEEAEEPLREAKEVVPGDGDARLLGQLALIENFYYALSMRFDASVESAQQAAREFRRAGAFWSLAEALSYVDMSLVFRGYFAESDEVEPELGPLTDRLGHWPAAAVCRRSRFAKVAARTADLNALEELSLVQLQTAEDVGNPGWLAYAHTLRGTVHLWRGNWETAQDEMEQGTRLVMPGQWFGVNHGFLVVLHALAGRAAEAHRVLSEVADSLPRSGQLNLLGQWHLSVLAAEAMGVLGDRDGAQALYPLVVEALATGTLLRHFDGGLLERSAAMAADAAGLDKQAEEHFEKALRQTQELPHLIEAPQVRHFYGRFLLDRGDTDQAAAMLERALDDYRTIGMPRHQAMTQQLLTHIS